MPDTFRYDNMQYTNCGHSGLKLPRVALGVWHNFGGVNSFENSRAMLLRAFDLGINHIDAANNYGPPPGSAEECVGRILKQDLSAYRDELIITSKAGYEMWPGPYGNWGSRKSLIASLDQSLKRMGLEYVDIFYHHRRDENTPLEESMGALADIVRQGKALYVGVSNYNADDTKKASDMLKGMGVKLIIHQHRYNMISRDPQENLYPCLKSEGIGSIAFCPLEQGLLTGKYLKDIPKDSRAASADSPFLNAEDISDKRRAMLLKLDGIAKSRAQTLAQMALAWTLREGGADYSIIGSSSVKQVEENVAALNNIVFSTEEASAIDAVIKEAGDL